MLEKKKKKISKFILTSKVLWPTIKGWVLFPRPGASSN